MTPEQEAKLREENDKLRKQTTAISMWDRFTGLFSGFGFFEMILVAVVLGGLWLAAKANPEYAEELAKMLPDSWQPTIHGMLNGIGIDTDMTPTIRAMAEKDMGELRTMLVKDGGMPKGVADIIAKDANSMENFMQIVRTANAPKDKDGKALLDKAGKALPGKVNTTSFANDKTIFSLLTNHPAIAQNITKAALADADAAKSDGTQKILTSLRAIIADDRLNVLMDSANRANTVALFKQFAPSGTANIDDKIRLLLADGFAADGKAKPFLRNSLLAMLTPGEDGALPSPEAAITKVAGQDPEAAKVLLDTAIKSLPPAQAVAVTALRTTLGDATMRAFMAASTGTDPVNASIRLALTPENIHALPQFVNVVTTTPQLASSLKQLPFKLDALNNFIQTTGMAGGKPRAALTTLATAIAQAPDLKLATLMQPLQAYILTPEVATNPQSALALKTFLGNLTTDGMPPDDIAKIATLQNTITSQRLQAMAALNKAGINPFALQKELFVTTNGTAQLSVNRALSWLMNGDNRTAIANAGTDKLAALVGDGTSFLNQKNIDAILGFANALDVPANNGGNAPRTAKIIGAVSNLMGGMPAKDASQQINAADLSGFFNVPANHNAFLALLNGVDQSVLTADQKTLVEGLRANIGNYKGIGFTSLLASENGAAFALKFIRGEIKTDDGFIASLLGKFEWVQDKALQQAGPEVAQNSLVIKNLGVLLRPYFDASATSTPTAPAAGQSAQGPASKGVTVAR